MVKKRIAKGHRGYRSMKRENWIDALKGVGIVLMVVGHADSPVRIEKMIYGFHMPLFFIIAGYLYEETKWNNKGLKELVRKRFRSYIIPYFVFGCCNLILNFGVEVLLYKNSFKGGIVLLIEHTFWLLYSYGLADKMPNCTPLWFLPCIFLCTVFFFFLAKVNNIIIKSSIYIGCLLIELILMKYVAFQLPWHIDVALLGVIFMQVGLSLKTIGVEKIRWYVVIVLAGLAIILINLNIKVDMNTNCIGNPILFFVGAILAVTVMMKLANYKIINNEILVYLGKNTIVIMAFNYFFNTITSFLWYETPIISQYEYTWWIKTLIVILLCCMVIEIKGKLVTKYFVKK